MSEVKVNKISPRANCGTVQLGDSGDTITIPAGATITNNGTQTGFGRTGTVDWVTTIQTSTPFTAVSGKGYFINTTSGAITMNLPSSPSAGDIVSVKDYARTFGDNAVTVGRGGSNIDGTAANGTLETSGLSVTLIYMDASRGWSLINDDTTAMLGAEYVAATGGTITTVCTNYKVHTFTGPGTFTVTNAGNCGGSNTVDYLVVAGGGAGGYANGGGAGGGAGGLRYSASTYCNPSPSGGAAGSALPVSAQGYPITVGGGGSGQTGSPDYKSGGDGANSIFSTITSAGGGGGAGGCTPGSTSPGAKGNSGGSGGGGGKTANPGSAPCKGVGGAGNTPPVSPSQGNDGGDGGIPNPNFGGGGGGHAAAGQDAVAPTSDGGDGGAGSVVTINGSATTYAGGGGGNAEGQPAPAQGQGGAGGGAAGKAPGANGNAGTANTGGGGGGIDSVPSPYTSGGGGSGIVIIRYKFQ